MDELEELEKLINERLTFIDERQQELMYRASNLQDALYTKIIEVAEPIKDIDKVLTTFYKPQLLQLTQVFVNDILSIGKRNAGYFGFMQPEGYSEAKKIADEYLLERLGLNSGGAIKAEGFLDLFINDTSVRQKVKSFAYKAQSSGKGITYFKKGISELLKDEKIVEKHFKTFAFDTYQQADATLQETYAVQLDFQAAFYAGTAVKGSREFCVKRKGKIFTRQEIADWAKLPKWNGRNEPYNPFIDRGGYGCLDSINWITNKMAMRRRKDLEEIEGKLKIKT